VVHIVVKMTCEHCKQLFYWKKYASKKLPSPNGRFCSRACTLAFYRDKKRKLPDRDTLIELYVVKRLSTCKIQKMYGAANPESVRKALLKYGVTLRRGKTQSCTVPGCKKPIHRIRHPNNGFEYGTLCLQHWKLHRAKLARWQHRKDRKSPPEHWHYKNEVPGRM
jgi:hypothetical protein